MARYGGIERDNGLVIMGGLVTRFVRICDDIDEVRKSLPDITPEEFRAIREGRAIITGDTKSGLHYKAV